MINYKIQFLRRKEISKMINSIKNNAKKKKNEKKFCNVSTKIEDRSTKAYDFSFTRA